MKIIITHGYSDSNKGDLAITSATIQAIRKLRPDAELILQSTFRQHSEEFWYHHRMLKKTVAIEEGLMPSPYTDGEKSWRKNLKAVWRVMSDWGALVLSLYWPSLAKKAGANQYQAVKRLREADLVIIKGGQFLYNDKEDLRGNIFLWRTLQPLHLARRFSKPTIVLGQSIGPFATSKSRGKVLRALKSCHKVFVRERLSQELLQDQLEARQLVLAADMAFLLKPKRPNLSQLKKWRKQRILGITMVNWKFPEQVDVQQARQNYLQNLVESIVHTVKTHRMLPVFVPQVTVRHHGKSDVELIREARLLLKKRGVQSHFIREDLSANEMAGLYRSCHLLIGTRLHSCILALTANTPVVAIRYQGYKTQGVMEMCGLEDLVHDINKLDSQALTASIDQVLENHSEMKRKVQSQVDKMRHHLREQLSEVLGVRQHKAPAKASPLRKEELNHT